MISNRYSKAKNPYVHDHDPTKETTYLMYLDANNLHGWAMSQSLPTGEFPDDNDDGYILEVDLPHPSELHNDYPLAPEKFTVSPEMLSPYCRNLATKLVPNIQDKAHYVFHYRNLKQSPDMGMRLVKIHC